MTSTPFLPTANSTTCSDYDDWDNLRNLELTLVDNSNDGTYEFALINAFKVELVTSLTANNGYFENVLDVPPTL